MFDAHFHFIQESFWFNIGPVAYSIYSTDIAFIHLYFDWHTTYQCLSLITAIYISMTYVHNQQTLFVSAVTVK